MVDGMRIESPNRVKGEFFHHFSSRFDKLDTRQAHIEMRYPKTVTCDQQVELESDMFNEEIKRVVWDYGIDKSPGPNGFTFGFYHRLWNLIENDVYDAVNPTKEFQFFKGLKQGGPLSPFLFILIMKSLHLSFQRVVDVGIFKGQWCDGNITTLVHVLECFYRALGLRINMNKSKIMGVLMDSDKVKCVASKLGCLILKTSFSYLGSKVGGFMSRVHTWNKVVDRVKNRLSKWKMKTLSIGGRLTLLKSILGSMPIFHMSTFRAPLTVLRTLESIHNEFFKGQELKSKKASWDRWIWALENLGDFFVASVRKVIDDKSLPKVDYKTRWIKYVPIKVNVHASKVKTDSLATRFNVSRRGIHIFFMCAIYDKGAETSSHLFFSSCMGRQTIRMITRWWDVPYGEVDSYEDSIN
uniref:RNA-directed DNA polymerase, eukaryota, reverse transcriptase zinc-binding domain protein n=1 Tax=Tanacetum cinerariifolium TaxID=118510 RepID=A0A6L2LVS9_TANCI|nr:RNA-directed DNA polymerase, eukaryota, reverse transcriptase zinc-binding domain protein [Tanacetum cinerariifolium]